MFSRARDGGIELALSRDERTLLASLTAELRGQLDGDTGEPSLRRLCRCVRLQ